MTIRTALGWVGVARSERGLLTTTLPLPTEVEAQDVLEDKVGTALHPALDDSLLSDTASRLARFYAGEHVDFDDLPLDDSLGSEFQRLVWAVVRRIPRGETRTYGEVAALTGKPKATRAVGQAMAHNPWPPIVPCHRVVGAGGKLVGFGGGLDLKQKLLEMEK